MLRTIHQYKLYCSLPSHNRSQMPKERQDENYFILGLKQNLKTCIKLIQKQRIKDEDQVDEILCFASSFNRMEVFFQMFIKGKLRGKLLSYAFKEAYQDSDNLFNHKEEIKKLFKKGWIKGEEMQTVESLKFIQELPKKVTIYRGMTLEEKRSGDFGISWTLNRDIATFFAHEYDRNFATHQKEKTVHSLRINKSDIIAYFNERNEDEILYLGDRNNNP